MFTLDMSCMSRRFLTTRYISCPTAVKPDVYYYMTFEDVHIFKCSTASIEGLKRHSDVFNFMNLEAKIPCELFTT